MAFLRTIYALKLTFSPRCINLKMLISALLFSYMQLLTFKIFFISGLLLLLLWFYIAGCIIFNLLRIVFSNCLSNIVYKSFMSSNMLIDTLRHIPQFCYCWLKSATL